MKKVFYIVLVIVILLVIGQIVRKNQTPAVEPEVVTVEENIAVENIDENADGAVAAEEEEVVVVDHEPAAEDTEVDENVVETNPEATAEEDETIVE